MSGVKQPMRLLDRSLKDVKRHKDVLVITKPGWSLSTTVTDYDIWTVSLPILVISEQTIILQIQHNDFLHLLYILLILQSLESQISNE